MRDVLGHALGEPAARAFRVVFVIGDLVRDLVRKGRVLLVVIDAVVAADFLHPETGERHEDVALAAPADVDAGRIRGAALGDVGLARFEKVDLVTLLAEGLHHADGKLAADLVGGLEEEGEPLHDRGVELHVADELVVGAGVDVFLGRVVLLDDLDGLVDVDRDGGWPGAVPVRLDRGIAGGIRHVALLPFTDELLVGGGKGRDGNLEVLSGHLQHGLFPAISTRVATMVLPELLVQDRSAAVAWARAAKNTIKRNPRVVMGVILGWAGSAFKHHPLALAVRGAGPSAAAMVRYRPGAIPHSG